MISVVNLEKSYANNKVLDNINFTFLENKINCIVGQNGAGKSTLLKCILGSTSYDSGDINFEKKISKFEISYLAEERGLYKNCTVFEQVKYFADISKVSNSKEKTEEAIVNFDLGAYAFTKIKKLSKGNAQKVQLACVFVSEPKLLILDEPFSGLDLINQKKIAEIIKNYSKRNTVIISTHQADFLDDFCDNILVIKKGRSVLAGKVADIIREQNKEIEIITSVSDVKYYKYISDTQISDLLKMNNEFQSFSIRHPKLTKIIKSRMEG